MQNCEPIQEPLLGVSNEKISENQPTTVGIDASSRSITKIFVIFQPFLGNLQHFFENLIFGYFRYLFRMYQIEVGFFPRKKYK